MEECLVMSMLMMGGIVLVRLQEAKQIIDELLVTNYDSE
jgi:hypothetical protein